MTKLKPKARQPGVTFGKRLSGAPRKAPRALDFGAIPMAAMIGVMVICGSVVGWSLGTAFSGSADGQRMVAQSGLEEMPIASEVGGRAEERGRGIGVQLVSAAERSEQKKTMRDSWPTGLINYRDRRIEVGNLYKRNEESRHVLTNPDVGKTKGRIVLIIDDLGLNHPNTRQMLEMPGKLSLSFLPYSPRLGNYVREAKDQGHEVMVHLPMEPRGKQDPGPEALMTWHSRNEMGELIDRIVARYPHFDAINNHMGSAFSANEKSMEWMLGELRKRGYEYVDSVTSENSKGADVAKRIGMDILARDVFLDHDKPDDPNVVKRQLRELERIAKRRGVAVGIGHPYDSTIAALGPWLMTLEERGFELITVRDALGRDEIKLAEAR